MIGSLLGQGYSPLDAAITGVFVHGLAGDLALKNESMESLTASDIILNIGAAFKHIQD
jgi:NAD(P)H-hydrate epimerase